MTQTPRYGDELWRRPCAARPRTAAAHSPVRRPEAPRRQQVRTRLPSTALVALTGVGRSTKVAGKLKVLPEQPEPQSQSRIGLQTPVPSTPAVDKDSPHSPAIEQLPHHEQDAHDADGEDDDEDDEDTSDEQDLEDVEVGPV